MSVGRSLSVVVGKGLSKREWKVTVGVWVVVGKGDITVPFYFLAVGVHHQL